MDRPPRDSGPPYPTDASLSTACNWPMITFHVRTGLGRKPPPLCSRVQDKRVSRDAQVPFIEMPTRASAKSVSQILPRRLPPNTNRYPGDSALDLCVQENRRSPSRRHSAFSSAKSEGYFSDRRRQEEIPNTATFAARRNLEKSPHDPKYLEQILIKSA